MGAEPSMVEAPNPLGAEGQGDDEMSAIESAVEDLDHGAARERDQARSADSVAELGSGEAAAAAEALPGGPAANAEGPPGTAQEEEPVTAFMGGEAKPPEAVANERSAAPAAQAPEAAAPALSSTYDPSRAKRAGWWSKARTALGGKE